MAPAKNGPKVEAVVDEAKGTVTIGVVHNGAFLPVATKDLGYSKAVGLSESGEPADAHDEGSEG